MEGYRTGSAIKRVSIDSSAFDFSLACSFFSVRRGVGIASARTVFSVKFLQALDSYVSESRIDVCMFVQARTAIRDTLNIFLVAALRQLTPAFIRIKLCASTYDFAPCPTCCCFCKTT